MKQMIKEIQTYLKKHLYLTYTIIFIILFTVAQLPFVMKDGTFTLKGYFSEPALYFDGLKQHIVFMYDYVSHIKTFLIHGGHFPVYRYNIGFGGDMLLSYGYYSLYDPVTIIAYLLPISQIGLSYFLIMTIRIYLSGLFMILLAKKLGIKKYNSLLLVGMVYAFSSPILFSAFRHPFFVNGPMYLPLLMLGAERILDKKSPLLFIVAVFFCAISQFYFFIYVAMGFGLYLVFRLFNELKERKLKSFLLIIFYALIGVLMASFVLYPTLLALIAGSRTSSKGIIHYSLTDIYTILLSQLIPKDGMMYSMGVGNIFLLFGSILYLFNKKCPHSFIKWTFLLFFLLGFSSLFGYAVNGFTYANNRWLFVIMVPVTLAVGFIIDGQVKPSLSDYKNSYRTMYLIILITICLVITQSIHILVINLFVYLISLGLIIRMLYKPYIPKWSMKIWKIQNYRKIILFLSLVTLLTFTIKYTVLNSPKNGFEIYYPNVDTYKNLFPDNSFYRVEQKEYEANFDKYSNDNLRYGYKSTYQYNSMTNGDVVNYFSDLGIINLNGTTGYNGLGGRTRLMDLNQVRYIIIRDSEKTLPPYGFKYLTSVEVPKYTNSRYSKAGSNLDIQNGVQVYEKANIYENQNFIHFGYMMYNTLDTKTFDSLDGLSKQKALFNYAILDNGDKVETNTLEKSRFTTVAENIKVENNTYQFTIPKIENQEVYIQVEGLTQENQIGRFEVQYETKDVSFRNITAPKGTNIYTDNSTQLADLGYYESENNLKVTLQFTKGIYDIKRIRYGLLETDDIANKAKSIDAHTLENLKFTGAGFSGNITTPKSGYLMITLPYSKGFTAQIDGVKTDVLKADIGFMAIKVPVGTHAITFTYTTPGLNPSLWVSGVAFITMIGIVGFVEIKKRKNKIKS